MSNIIDDICLKLSSIAFILGYLNEIVAELYWIHSMKDFGVVIFLFRSLTKC